MEHCARFFSDLTNPIFATSIIAMLGSYGKPLTVLLRPAPYERQQHETEPVMWIFIPYMGSKLLKCSQRF
jgi:hypothetical protein